jgi:Spy/CpxP family protein refolding chaperone
MRRTLIALAIAGALAASGCAARSAASQPPTPAAAHQHPPAHPRRAATAAGWRHSSPEPA